MIAIDNVTHRPALELSKLDFAYQLIRHSSLANKLMLTVRRFLNPAYARASVAAANIRSHSISRAPLDRVGDSGGEQSHQAANTVPNKSKRGAFGLVGGSGLHYSYKCCECYCDKEG